MTFQDPVLFKKFTEAMQIKGSSKNEFFNAEDMISRAFSAHVILVKDLNIKYNKLQSEYLKLVRLSNDKYVEGYERARIDSENQINLLTKKMDTLQRIQDLIP